MRAENRNGEGECYQVNSKVRAVYDDKTYALSSLKIDGVDVDSKKLYTIAMMGYHLTNSKAYMNISNEELLESGKSKVVSTSAQEVLEEWLRNHQNETRKIEGRLVYS